MVLLFQSDGDVDRNGHRVLVATGSAYGLFLTRALPQANGSELRL
jgi:hypothetical protein